MQKPLRWTGLGSVMILGLFFTSGVLASFAAASPKELLAAGRADEAIQILEQQTRQPDSDRLASAESYNLLCRAYYMIDDWDRGVAACERAKTLDPKNSLYQVWLGRLYGEKAQRAGFVSAAGLAKKVRLSFEQAVESDPQNSEARSDLAEFYLDAPAMVGGGKAKARAQADALMPLDPGAAHLVLARLAAKNKDGEDAEREYRAAITMSHSGAHATFEMAYFLFHADKLDQMDQALRTLESCTLDRPEALLDGASILVRADRDYDLAARLLRRYLQAPVEEGPAFKAHELLGRVLEKQGDRRAAAAEYRAALTLSRSYRRAEEDLKRVEH